MPFYFVIRLASGSSLPQSREVKGGYIEPEDLIKGQSNKHTD
jgi:hypothetical protein